MKIISLEQALEKFSTVLRKAIIKAGMQCVLVEFFGLVTLAAILAELSLNMIGRDDLARHDDACDSRR